MSKPKVRINHRQRLVQAAMDLAAQKGWAALTMEDLAKKLRLKPESLRKHFPEKNDILLAVISQADAALKTMPEDGDSLHDRLFECLMLRLDANKPYRRGIAAILRAIPSNPCLFKALVQPLCRSMERALQAAGANETGVVLKLKSLGLLAVYAATLRVWTEDETADNSKTMATLDRHLRQAGIAAEFLRL